MRQSPFVAIFLLSIATAAPASAQLVGEKYVRYPDQPACTLFVSIDKVKTGLPLPSDCIKLRRFQKVTYLRNVGGREVIDVGGRIYFTFGRCDYADNTSPSKSCFTFRSNARDMRADDVKFAQRTTEDAKKQLDKCLDAPGPGGDRAAAGRKCAALAATYEERKRTLDLLRRR